MREMTMETFYIINQIPKINRAHWNLPWMSCILKFRSLKISLETLERSFHRGEKTEICREASWDIWNSPFFPSWCPKSINICIRQYIADPSCCVHVTVYFLSDVFYYLESYTRTICQGDVRRCSVLHEQSLKGF